jgi:hypothetical protein
MDSSASWLLNVPYTTILMVRLVGWLVQRGGEQNRESDIWYIHIHFRMPYFAHATNPCRKSATLNARTTGGLCPHSSSTKTPIFDRACPLSNARSLLCIKSDPNMNVEKFVIA